MTKNDYSKRVCGTPGGRFALLMAETFSMELKRLGLTKNEFYRTIATTVSAPTFYRMLDGSSGANCCLVATVADKLGYELTLVKKPKNSNAKTERNDNNH